MAGKSKSQDKTYFKVTFTHNGEVYQVCAGSVGPSDLYGLIEIAEFQFPQSGLVYNPGEERLRKEFEGIRRTWVPYHAIIRIDEVSDNRAEEIKIVPLHLKKDEPVIPPVFNPTAHDKS